MSHSHDHSQDTSANLGLAFGLNLAFTILEVIGGFWTNSLAILSDAVHDLGDSISLGLAWLLERYSAKESDRQFSYGYRRFSLLGALITAIVLLSGSALIVYRAIPRLLDPEPTNASGMILLAIVGVLVNGYSALRLRGDKTLNARVVGLHLVEDVLGWLAVLIVAVVLLFTDYYWLDPLTSILIALYIGFGVARNLWETAGLFLQSVPRGIDLDEIDRAISAVENVQSAHHIHVWSLDGDHHVVSAHVVVDKDLDKVDARRVKEDVKEALDAYPFTHMTLEIEYGETDCAMALKRREENAGEV